MTNITKEEYALLANTVANAHFAGGQGKVVGELLDKLVTLAQSDEQEEADKS